MGGGILYNKKVFSELGLLGPHDVGRVRGQQRQDQGRGHRAGRRDFGDTWTSQLFVLADYFNVQSAVPDFAEKYTANEAHYADTPAALAGFQHLQEGFEKDWWQKDFAQSKFDDGLELLAEGKIAHYPMLTFAARHDRENYPEVNDVGFFGQPGRTPPTAPRSGGRPPRTSPSRRSTTPTWPRTSSASSHPSKAPTRMTAAIPPSGPYVINGATLPADVLPAVKDIQTYIEANNTAPALEFLSPVKGPSLEQITVAVGSGLDTAEDGAAQYDQDVENRHSSWACRAGKHAVVGVPHEADQEVDRVRRVPRLALGAPDAGGTRLPPPASRAGAYPYWFYLPARILFVVIFLVPTLLAFFFSLTRWTLFDGLHRPRQLRAVPESRRYERPAQHARLRRVTSGLKVVIGLPLAALLTSSIRLGRIRAIIFFPVLVSTVAVGITFAVLMHPSAASSTRRSRCSASTAPSGSPTRTSPCFPSPSSTCGRASDRAGHLHRRHPLHPGGVHRRGPPRGW